MGGKQVTPVLPGKQYGNLKYILTNRLYAWTSSQANYQRTVRNQIELILVNVLCSNSINYVKTYSGADVSSAHSPPIARMHRKINKTY